MVRRLVLDVVTPLGHRVVLTRDRWRQIVRFKHPAIDGHQTLLKMCLSDPVLIRESSQNEELHLYYRQTDKRYVCVVTAPANETEHFVVTAYFTTKPKKGRELWTK